MNILLIEIIILFNNYATALTVDLQTCELYSIERYTETFVVEYIASLDCSTNQDSYKKCTFLNFY